LSPQDFVAQYRTEARAVAAALALNPLQPEAPPESFPLAHWALETGWGQDVAGHNLAGIIDGHGGFATYGTPEEFQSAYVHYMNADCPNLRVGQNPATILAGTRWNLNPGYPAEVQAVWSENIVPLLAELDAPKPVPEPDPAPAAAEPEAPIVVPENVPVPEPTTKPFDFTTPGQEIGVYPLAPTGITDLYEYALSPGIYVSADPKATDIASFHLTTCEVDTGTTNKLGLILPATVAQQFGVKATGQEAILGATGGEIMGDATVAVALVDLRHRAVILQDVPCTIDPQLQHALLGTQPFISRGVGQMFRPVDCSMTLFTDKKGD